MFEHTARADYRYASAWVRCLYGDRINVVDMRFANIVRFGRTRANVGMDVYNLFNTTTPTTYETVYDPRNGARWMQPTAVLLPRFMRSNAQVEF